MGTRVFSAGLLLAMLGAGLGCIAKDAAVTGVPGGVEAGSGATLWAREGCAACHGPEASEGQRPLHGLRARYTLATLSELLASPPPPMPHPRLDRDERQVLANYLLMRFGD